jgi:integrase
VNLERGVLVVDQSVSNVNGHLTLGPTKTGQGRAVSIPNPMTQDLANHPGRRVGPAPDALVFTSEAGGLVGHANWYRRYSRPAVKRAELPEGLRYHDLRHT